MANSPCGCTKQRNFDDNTSCTIVPLVRHLSYIFKIQRFKFKLRVLVQLLKRVVREDGTFFFVLKVLIHLDFSYRIIIFAVGEAFAGGDAAVNSKYGVMLKLC